MKDNPKDLGLSQLPKSFDTVLQYGSALAAYSICHNRCRDQVIRVENYHILGVINDALAGCIKVADQMDVRFFAAWAVKPRLAQDDNLLSLALLILDQ